VVGDAAVVVRSRWVWRDGTGGRSAVRLKAGGFPRCELHLLVMRSRDLGGNGVVCRRSVLSRDGAVRIECLSFGRRGILSPNPCQAITAATVPHFNHSEGTIHTPVNITRLSNIPYTLGLRELLGRWRAFPRQ